MATTKPTTPATPDDIAQRLAALQQKADEAQRRADEAEERVRVSAATEADLRDTLNRLAGHATQTDRSVYTQFNHGTGQDPKWLAAYWLHDHSDSLDADRERVKKAGLLAIYRQIRRSDGDPEPIFFPPPKPQPTVRGNVPGALASEGA